MHDYLVDKRRWISSSRFFHALSICMLLPGPEAQQLAIYIGWKLHGKKGGLVAGILFVLPSMFILLGLSILYTLYGKLPFIDALFSGLKPAVISIIILALYRVGKKALKTALQFVAAGVAFACIFFYDISMLSIIAGAIVLALVIRKWFPSQLNQPQEEERPGSENERDYFLNKYSEVSGPEFGGKNLVRELVSFFILWVFPLVLFYFFSAEFSFWKSLVFFFTQAAFFTIGGSYTVLPYVAQFAVTRLNWLSKSQMVDGFALAETTPGPLIIVVTFVGFMAGYHHFQGSLWLGGVALLLTTYYTFLPCFLFIFAGGPLIEKSHGHAAIQSILELVTAAVVGVILNLTLFLGKEVLFPAGGTGRHADYLSLGWIIISLILMLKWKLNFVIIILLSLLFGVFRFWIP
jgi:chromate transporter